MAKHPTPPGSYQTQKRRGDIHANFLGMPLFFFALSGCAAFNKTPAPEKFFVTFLGLSSDPFNGKSSPRNRV